MDKDLVFWGEPTLWGKRLYQHVMVKDERARLQSPALLWSEVLSVPEAFSRADQYLDQFSGAMIGDWNQIQGDRHWQIHRRMLWVRSHPMN